MNMDGKLLQRTISKVFPTNREKSIVELLMLFSIGLLALVLRTNVKMPFNIPGHHGILVMMLFMIGRASTERKIASSYSAIAASSYLLFFYAGLKDPFLPLIYIIMGVAIDCMFILTRKWNTMARLVIFVLIGGLVYMIIPFSRLIIHLSTGFPYHTFLRNGYLIPHLSHFTFGAMGSFLGAGLILSFKKRKK